MWASFWLCFDFHTGKKGSYKTNLTKSPVDIKVKIPTKMEWVDALELGIFETNINGIETSSEVSHFMLLGFSFSVTFKKLLGTS